MKYLEEAWTLYRQLVINKNEESVPELREAFYAGAGIFHKIVQRIMCSKDEPTTEEIKILSGIQAEIAFFEEKLNAKFLKSLRSRIQ